MLLQRVGVRLAGVGMGSTRARTVNAAARALAARSVAPVAVPVRGFASLSPATAERITMSLEEYDRQARRLRYMSYAAGIPVAGAGVFSSSFYTATNFPEIFDPTVPPTPLDILGTPMDPMFIAVLGSSTFMFFSFFMGVSLFKRTWRLFNSARAHQMDLRQQDLAIRVQKSRTKVEMEKMSDDYYGSSIRNSASYRQWLKSQRARRKAEEKLE